MHDSNDEKRTESRWGIGCLAIFIFLYLLGSALNKRVSTTSQSLPQAVESNEDKLRRVYDSQGIRYDDQMIREDAKAIEQLHREFGR
jgi:hypothetical protein